MRRPVRGSAALWIVVFAIASSTAVSGAVAPQYTGSWSRANVASVPGAAQAMAYDPGRGQLVAVVLDPSSGNSWTSVLTGSSWHNASGPSFFAGHVRLVFDAALGKVVAISYTCAETWDGTVWSQPSCAPYDGTGGSARAAFFDPDMGILIDVVDAFTGNCCGEEFVGTQTWTWDGTTWRRLSPKTEPTPLNAPQPQEFCPDISCETVVALPIFPEYGDATWDAARHVGLLVGDAGRTWTWNGNTWSGGAKVAPSAGQVSVTYDPNLGTGMAYGYPERTARWTGTIWQPVATTGLPHPWGPMAWDPQAGGLVMLGAPSPGLKGPESTLWVFTAGV